MSIAFNAAPFDANIPKTFNDRKKRNKTIKKDREKVNNMIDMIHNSSVNKENEEDGFANFNPPPKPELKRKNMIETMDNINTINDIEVNDNSELNDMISPENYNKIENQYSKQENFEENIVPYYNYMSQPNDSKDVLIKKINYMIHLLEEQQEIKTEHVTEELILYSFLGVFIIFIIDSFARAGKYVR
tara:strand:- start:338 stop:901 length:564 start_codon:yes stop_codon:yes gene_type:complete